MADPEPENPGLSSSLNMSSKKELLSTAMKRTSEWYGLLLFNQSFFKLAAMEVFTVSLLGLFCSVLFLFRIFSQEIPSDVTVHVGEASFSLHKVQQYNSSSKFEFRCVFLSLLQVN